jgi:di/tricarboxylate transporter
MDIQIMLVLIVLAAAVVLFVTEALRVDVIAIIIMLTLGWLGLVSPSEAFSGFASNAVISIIAVMILGYGIDKTGVMLRLARTIIAIAGSSEKRLISVISSVVGLLSAFMQNIGSAALFLPAMLRISKTTKIPPSRLIMPMGFAAILGGTVSMIGSSPLILLNDLLLQDNLEPFGIFAVTPVGLALLATGIAYFIVLGKYVLPSGEGEKVRPTQEVLVEVWQLPTRMHHFTLTENSPLVGKTRDEIELEARYRLYLLAVTEGEDVLYAPWRYTVFAAGQTISLLGDPNDAETFAREYELRPVKDQIRYSEKIGGINAGFAEVVVRPHAKIIGKSLREISFRKNYGVEPIVFLSGELERRKDFTDQPLSAGDTLVVYGPWTKIGKLGAGFEWVLITPVEETGFTKSKGTLAILCFVGGIALTFTGVPISLGLLTGAIAMVLTGVLTIDDAYRSVDWRTVFLLAGLIPLGIAMDQTGGAAYIANLIMQIFSGSHPIAILFAIAILTTFFSLFMSNVAATVLLVPLVLFIGADSGIDPRGLALLVGVCASNSFILPTHQVNAFLMTPGGYRNADYLKAGGIMTILFLLVAVGLIYILYT